MKSGIFGIGNELREDDGIGLAIVAKLKAIFFNDNVDLITVAGRLFEIPVLMRSYSRIVIIDALPPDLEPGKVTVSRYENNNFLFPQRYSLHDLDLLWQLQDAFRSGFKGEILLIGIEAGSLSYKEGLSLGLGNSLPDITLKVVNVIREFCGLIKGVAIPIDKAFK